MILDEIMFCNGPPITGQNAEGILDTRKGIRNNKKRKTPTEFKVRIELEMLTEQWGVAHFVNGANSRFIP